MTVYEYVVDIDPVHVDCYGHLNNALYPHYFEMGRKGLQMLLGIGERELIEQGAGLWVQDSYTRRLKQVKAFEEVEMRSEMVGRKGPFVYMRHSMLRDGALLAYSLTEHFFVKLGDPPAATDIPSGVAAVVEELPFERDHRPGLVRVLEYLEERKRRETVERLRGGPA